MSRFYIAATGPATTPGMDYVVKGGRMATFPTRKAARQYADDVVIPATPSKYYPLVVREVKS